MNQPPILPSTTAPTNNTTCIAPTHTTPAHNLVRIHSSVLPVLRLPRKYKDKPHVIRYDWEEIFIERRMAEEYQAWQHQMHMHQRSTRSRVGMGGGSGGLVGRERPRRNTVTGTVPVQIPQQHGQQYQRQKVAVKEESRPPVVPVAQLLSKAAPLDLNPFVTTTVNDEDGDEVVMRDPVEALFADLYEDAEHCSYDLLL